MNYPVAVQGLQCKVGTSRNEPATSATTEKRLLEWRENPSISVDKRQQRQPGRKIDCRPHPRERLDGGAGCHVLEGVDCGASPDAPTSRARHSAWNKSRDTYEKGRPTIEWRATRTMSAGFVMKCCFKRKASRISRRARFRTTAPPSFRLVIMPTRDSEPEIDGPQFRTRHPHEIRPPSILSLPKTRPSRRRFERGNWNRTTDSAMEAVAFRPRAAKPG
jgi:hypothetical protein